MMRRQLYCSALIASMACAPKVERGPAAVDQAQAPVQILEVLTPGTRILYLQALIAAGSARDPVGKEGLASLTAQALTTAGAGDRTATDVRETLYPTGNEFELIVEREWVSLRLTCHIDHAERCIDVFGDALTSPTFDSDEVARVRDRQLNWVTQGILGDEEALGMEVFHNWVFEAHPYGHPVQGRSGVLDLLTSEDVQTFYSQHYVRQSIVAGIAGDFTTEQVNTLRARLEEVPGHRAPELVLQKPIPVTGRSLLAVDTSTPVTGFHLGHPLEVTRNHEDYAALYLAMTAFGSHRQSFGRLFQRIRGARGLNYGDYAYTEAYVERPGSSMPEQGVLRQQPSFYVWLRPTSIENGPFTLKLALHELHQFVEHGLDPEEFSDTQQYLVGGLPLLARDPGRQLAYALDAVATQTPNLLDDTHTRIGTLSVDQVNAAIRRHIRPDDLKIVAVSGEAETLRQQLSTVLTTPIIYADVTPSEAQAAEDAMISNVAIDLDPQWARVVPAEGIFR